MKLKIFFFFSFLFLFCTLRLVLNNYWMEEGVKTSTFLKGAMIHDAVQEATGHFNERTSSFDFSF